ncbi:MAG: tetraacyldisaccharide 4'-kinase [Betaproteobacteria bacterium]|nr:tetraacyldisaccharide 4'-kinase [Betaproteobacteria bacterium]MDE2622172.1 tetraacyldisaccharide 4'-kinase [Betaproteobacteria bacterium]
MERWLLLQWYGREAPPVWLLPLSFLFRLVVALRRRLYAAGWLGSRRLPVPVLVVGNITVGGTGKTPLTIALVEALRRQGWHPGIICRGYGASARSERRVEPGDDPAEAGDEAVLMASRTGVPVWAGRDRSATGRALLQAHPDVDLLVSDDGLQHLALARTMEIAVVDGARLFGNGALLPAGPLREPLARLDSVDAVVINGPARTLLSLRVPQFGMALRPQGWVSLDGSNRACDVGHFSGKRAHAVAGIGHPQRFFRLLETLGIGAICHPFPDHHRFRHEELRFEPAAPLLMTEKDGIKCRKFALPDSWMLPVEAVLDPALLALVDQTLRRRGHGPTTA